MNFISWLHPRLEIVKPYNNFINSFYFSFFEDKLIWAVGVSDYAAWWFEWRLVNLYCEHYIWSSIIWSYIYIILISAAGKCLYLIFNYLWTSLNLTYILINPCFIGKVAVLTFDKSSRDMMKLFWKLAQFEVHLFYCFKLRNSDMVTQRTWQLSQSRKLCIYRYTR